MSEVPAWSLTATDLEDLPPLLGRSDSQKNAYRAALVYMNRYAVTEKKYPKLNQMTKEHVEGDCIEGYLQDYGGWFAREKILTKPKIFLATDSKVIGFGLAKEILQHKFKEHDLWKRDETGWWTEMRSDFKKSLIE